MKLRRYWIEFEVDAPEHLPLGTLLGCGVTGYDQEDALQLLRQHIFDGAPLPPIRRLIEDVDISILDANHVRPNMGVPVWRGVWFPRLDG
jgi:hypothetical protein